MWTKTPKFAQTLAPKRKAQKRLRAVIAPDTRKLPQRDNEREEKRDAGGHIVVIYDNDKNTYEEVTSILMLATQCTLQEAEIETWEVDHLGKSVVHHGGEGECQRVAGIIRTIGMRVEVIEE